MLPLDPEKEKKYKTAKIVYVLAWPVKTTATFLALGRYSMLHYWLGPASCIAIIIISISNIPQGMKIRTGRSMVSGPIL